MVLTIIDLFSANFAVPQEWYNNHHFNRKPYPAQRSIQDAGGSLPFPGASSAQHTDTTPLRSWCLAYYTGMKVSNFQ
jgi:hypothetical protein